MADEQAEAAAGASGLGAEKGREDGVDQLGLDTGTVVDYLDAGAQSSQSVVLIRIGS